MTVNLRGFNPLDQNDLAATPEIVRQTMRNRALTETYYLAQNVLGYDKLTIHTHGPVCRFLDTCTALFRLIQMPRSHFKSTLVTITARIQDVLRDPGVRILIVGDTAENAQRHLLKIKNHFDRNRLLRWLFSDRIWEDTSQAAAWSKVNLYLPNDAPHGEPTFDTIGARGAAVSRHYNTIDADDLIGEDEYYSSTEMDKTIDWFTGLEALFAPPLDECRMDIPSTYWRTDDVYAFAEEFYGRGKPKIPTGPFSYQCGELAVFRRGNIENGQPIFPELKGDAVKTMDYFSRLLEKNPERYAAQYANNPYSSELAYFRPEYIRYYDVRSDDGMVLSINHKPMNETEIVRADRMNITSMCDPHAGGGLRFRGGKAAVITTGVDPKHGRVFILDCWLKRAPTDQIIDEIIRQNEKWNPQVFSIEANGLQKMLKFWLDERVVNEKRIPVPYVPFIPKGDKDSDRRIRGLQPLFRAGQIFGQRGFVGLWEEYFAFPRGSMDGLDALSQGLGHWDIGFDSVEEDTEEYERVLRSLRNVATGY